MPQFAHTTPAAIANHAAEFAVDPGFEAARGFTSQFPVSLT
jgi:hypothetical protein